MQAKEYKLILNACIVQNSTVFRYIRYIVFALQAVNKTHKCFDYSFLIENSDYVRCAKISKTSNFGFNNVFRSIRLYLSVFMERNYLFSCFERS